MAVLRDMVWFLLVLLFSCAQSQNGVKDTKGKAFTVAFFPEYTSNPSTKLKNILYLASNSDGSCTISYHDSSRRSTQVTLHAHEVAVKALPDNTQMTNIGTGIEPKAIYVDCDVDISLYGFNKASAYSDTADSFTVFPDSVLSTDYLIASTSNTAFIGIAPTQPNTKVSIHVMSNCAYRFNSKSYDSGSLVNVTLQHGDVFRLGGTVYRDSCDLKGTEIHSSEPVSVFAGALFSIEDGKNIRHLVDQVPPISAFSETIIIPGVSKTLARKTSFRAIASTDLTTLNVTSESNSGTTQTKSYHLDRGEVLDITCNPDTDVIVQSTLPVMVVQQVYFEGEGGVLMTIPGITQYDNNFLIRSFDLDATGTEPITVTVVTESASTEYLRVNGVYPQNVVWSNLTTLPYSVGTFTIHRGVSYVISSNSQLLVRVMESYNYQSYGYIAGYRLGGGGAVVKLKCFPDGWFVTVDLSNLYPRTDDVSHIYMTNDECTGTVQGHLLVFNKSYHDCSTRAKMYSRLEDGGSR